MNRQYLAKFGAAGDRDWQPQTAPIVPEYLSRELQWAVDDE